MNDLKEIKGSEHEEEKNYYTENFNQLIEMLIDHLDISHRNFCLNLVFFLYHTKLESVDDFLNYYVKNIEDIYF